MKKIIILFIAITSAFTTFSQTSLSCTYRETCLWLPSIQKWSTDCSGYEESSLFVVNDDETVFIHTTEDIKSSYYVTSKESGEDGMFTYYVMSDVGNKYFVVIDTNSKELKFVDTSDDDSSKWRLVRWYIKAIF